MNRSRPALLLALALAAPAAPARELCPPYAYTLAFFNGVWNTPDDAADGARALHAALAAVLPPAGAQQVGTDVFYNASGLQRGLAGGVDDLVEVFQQRAAELDDALRRRWELFWEVFDGQPRLWRRLADTAARARELAATLVQARQARLVAMTAALAAQPPTAFDYAAHEARLRALRVLGRGLLLVGHSQGNFFLNRAYPLAQSMGAPARAVHVAPASMALQGPHLLSSNDAVIAALRSFLPGAPPPANIDLPMDEADPTGHALLETYLDPGRGGRMAVARLMAAQLSALPPSDAQAEAGFFTATLTWDGPGDLDLHVFEPGGAHVYYDHRQGNAGALDLDNTAGRGPEHYHASCLAQRLQAGTYTLGVNHYADAAGRSAMLQVASAERGVLRTVRMDAGPERGKDGDATPVPMLQVVVKQDASSWSVEVP